MPNHSSGYIVLSDVSIQVKSNVSFHFLLPSGQCVGSKVVFGKPVRVLIIWERLANNSVCFIKLAALCKIYMYEHDPGSFPSPAFRQRARTKL